jgi:hypothetical protein
MTRSVPVPPPRPLAAAVAVACAGTLLTGIGYAVSGFPGGRADHSASPSGPSGTARPAERPEALDRAAVRAVLDRRSRAVQERDHAAFVASVDPSFRTRQEEVFANLAKLPLTGWREQADSDAPPTAGPGGWTVQVTLRYRLRGYDRTDDVGTQYLTFARGATGGLMITGDGAAQNLSDDTQIWDGGRLSVARGRRSLVIGSRAPSRTLRQIAAQLDEAAPTVTGVVGDRWAQRVVALVPATEEQTASLAGGGQSLREIAALATVTRGPGGSPGNDRIIVSPVSFPKLNNIGRHVVLTHELTHVATHGAGDRRTPFWLIEGFADYVGYKGLQVPVRAAARELRSELVQGRLPKALPGREEFEAAGRLSQAYEEAWLACRMIVERYGEERLVRLYDTAGKRDDAIKRVLGIDTADFTAMWRAYLREELT